MIGEMDKILKGKLEATVQFDSSKKIIGVSTSNLLPSSDGIVPLSKQGAFEKLKENNSPAVSAIDALTDTLTKKDDEYENIEKLDLQNLSDQKIPGTLNVSNEEVLNSQGVSPLESDIVIENPLDVQNPHELDGFSIGSDFEKSILNKPVETSESKSEENKFLNLQMPQMPTDVPAQEPNDNLDLFESIPSINDSSQNNVTNLDINTNPVVNSQKENETPLSAPALDDINPVVNSQKENENSLNTPALGGINPVVNSEKKNETPLSAPALDGINPNYNMGAFNPINVLPQDVVDIDAILEKNKKELIDKSIEKLRVVFDEYSKALESLYEDALKQKRNNANNQLNTAEKDKLVQSADDKLTPLVDDAISRINNMVIPQAPSGPQM